MWLVFQLNYQTQSQAIGSLEMWACKDRLVMGGQTDLGEVASCRKSFLISAALRAELYLDQLRTVLRPTK